MRPPRQKSRKRRNSGFQRPVRDALSRIPASCTRLFWLSNLPTSPTGCFGMKSLWAHFLRQTRVNITVFFSALPACNSKRSDFDFIVLFHQIFQRLSRTLIFLPSSISLPLVVDGINSSYSLQRLRPVQENIPSKPKTMWLLLKEKTIFLRL